MLTAGLLALDRSLRRYDVDGRLHVSDCCISKANVCPYFGKEIPDYIALGLDPDRVYQMYRDPTELAAAASSFANMPLMLHHVGVTADNPEKDLIVGTIGSDVRFEAPYLVADLAVWTADGIEVVETGAQQELSCGYRYRADMTPGVADGVAYDGVMRDIKANHVALVRKGRAGPDVLVHDEQPPGVLQMKSRFLTALFAALKITPTAEQQAQVQHAYDAEMATEAYDADLSDVEKKTACDEYAKELGKDALSDEEKDEAYKRAAKDKKARDEAAKTAGAMDAAIKAAVTTATAGLLTQDAANALATKAAADAVAAERALVAARTAVEPLVGAVTCDTAEAVYRLALEKTGATDHATIAVDALPAAVAAAVSKKTTAATVTADAALDASATAFPGLSRFRKG